MSKTKLVVSQENGEGKVGCIMCVAENVAGVQMTYQKSTNVPYPGQAIVA